MIFVKVNKDNLEYDIYALLKSFYPEEEISISILQDGETMEESVRVPSFYDVKVFDSYVSCALNEDGNITVEKEDISGSQKADIKNALKRCVYKCVSKKSGCMLPWGILTGIRPVKLPMLMLDKGWDDEHISKYLGYNYLISDEKISLSLQIAHKEKEILKRIDRYDGYSLYIGIPFCPTTCLYCSFTSYPIAKWKDRVDDYISCVKKELDLVHELVRGRAPDSVYIGGGTPTTLSGEQFKDLLGYLKGSFDFDKVLEFTVEAGRPDSITEEKLMTLKELGVSRISINPQTMNGGTLKLIGRRHTIDDVKEAFKIAKNCGFANINTDIILGLPGEDIEHVKHTMEEIRKLEPASLTVHSMAIKRAAKMAEYLKEHEDIKSINTPEMMAEADRGARMMGMSPYYLYRQKNMAGNFENVGYAREGFHGIYNILIMEEVQSIIACGAGTVSKRVYEDGLIERCDNVKDVDLYMNRLDEMLERKRKLFSCFSYTA
ncbi:MAG: coproporphyrinogen dehydrogenase HemZ [Lachnospiraceae bacterium]|nr:coproporphyrinogen dehydrogenase HemZ [Lachnospiraceae bacterium]